MIRTVEVLIVVIGVYGRNGEVLQERPISIQIRHVITLKAQQYCIGSTTAAPRYDIGGASAIPK